MPPRNQEVLKFSPEATKERLTALSGEVWSTIEKKYREDSLKRAQMMAASMEQEVPSLQEELGTHTSLLDPKDEEHIETVLEGLKDKAPTDAEVPKTSEDMRAYRGPEARYLQYDSETRSFVLDPKYYADLQALRGVRENPKYKENPAFIAFLERVIRTMETYGGGDPKNTAESPGVDGKSYALWEFHQNRYPYYSKGLKTIGRLAGIAILIPYTLLTGIIAIVKKESPTPALLGGGLAYFLANMEQFLDPADKRRRKEAGIVTDTLKDKALEGIPQGKWQQIVENFWSSPPQSLQSYMNVNRYQRLFEEERAQLTSDIIADLGPTFTDSEKQTLARLIENGKLRTLFERLRKTSDKDTRELVLATLELRGRRT